MTLQKKKHYSDTSRMRLLGLVKLASERVAVTWPMHTLIQQNPLHDLEDLPFNKAVVQGKLQQGGEGYLSNPIYRRYYQSGRILQKHLDTALQAIASQNKISLANHTLTHLEVLRAHFIHGFSAPSPEILETSIENHSDALLIKKIADRFYASIQPIDIAREIDTFTEDYHSGLGRCLSLSGWFDHIFGTEISEKINQEMIKWCLPFLDEGQAPWPFPFREKGLFQSWKIMASHEWDFGGIPKMRKKLLETPDLAADALLESLEKLGIPEEAWQDYLGMHLSALPGWTAFIKWRTEHHDYRWQEAYPIDLVQVLAIRLWYERERLTPFSREFMDSDGTMQAILAFTESYPKTLFLLRERTEKRLSASDAKAVDHLSAFPLRSNYHAWETLADQYVEEIRTKNVLMASLSAAWRLVSLIKTLDCSPETLLKSHPKDLKQYIDWIDAAPETTHGPVWLEAFEAGYQEALIKKLRNNTEEIQVLKEKRPHAQAVFCLDVRSGSFRRHLKKIGHYETFGFAGFFTVFIRYMAFDRHHETDLYPAVVKAKNTVKEIPRPSQKEKVPRYHAGAALIHAAHTLLHDLKENVITPYVMVESIGWFFGIPLIGKTLFPSAYQKFSRWLRQHLAPPVATTMTIDKLTRESVELVISAEQQVVIQEALYKLNPGHKKSIDPKIIGTLRKMALEEGTSKEALDPTKHQTLTRFFETPEALNDFVQTLREDHFITEAWASARMERITRTGFSPNEQIFTVKTALKAMGLTKNFAKLVLFCAHGSTSDNNPYEASLDCGACGGNPGNPNARVFAALANKPHVREHLKTEGFLIPEDTHFIAGQHNTTTDEVVIYDIEDLPPSHKKALAQLMVDLKQAGLRNSQERCGRFPDITSKLDPEASNIEVIRRSTTWSQTRPEWGLSGNAGMVISRNQRIEGVDMNGRVFLHSYNYKEDPTSQLLEIIMTGPLVVGQWINMGYYFSSTDNNVYGSGSKIYHNVAGRIGVMHGSTSDLRIGLPSQTVFNGEMPYHEPMRLFTIIEAPRTHIQKIISRHRVLRDFFDNQWVHLVALENNQFYRYLPKGTWREEKES